MFSARDGFTQASSAPATDPYWTSVVTLLRTNSASGGTNNRVVLDSSSNNLTIGYGTTPINRFSYDSPFTSVWGSLYMSGVAGAAVKFPANAVLTFAGDFTIEGWGKVPNGTTLNAYAELISSIAAQNNGIFARNVNATPPRWAIQGYNTPTFAAITSAVTSNDGVWRHLAWVRNGSGSNNMSFYVDGALIGSFTNTSSINYSTGNIGCGTGTGNPGQTDNQFNGNISNIRLSNIARYTAAFTRPSSPFTSDANTMALIAGSNAAYLDISNSKIPTLQNNTNISQTGSLQKFSGLNSIASINNAGYLQLAPSTISLTGDFTLEVFVYVATGTAQNTSSVIYSCQNIVLYSNTSTYVNTFTANVAATDINSGVNARDSTWHHLAIVRNGTGSNNITFYVDGVSVGTISSNSTLSASNATVCGLTTTNTQLKGNISELRLTNGVARYTSNFTPPTEPFPTS